MDIELLQPDMEVMFFQFSPDMEAWNKMASKFSGYGVDDFSGYDVDVCMANGGCLKLKFSNGSKS